MLSKSPCALETLGAVKGGGGRAGRSPVASGCQRMTGRRVQRPECCCTDGRARGGSSSGSCRRSWKTRGVVSCNACSHAARLAPQAALSPDCPTCRQAGAAVHIVHLPPVGVGQHLVGPLRGGVYRAAGEPLPPGPGSEKWAPLQHQVGGHGLACSLANASFACSFSDSSVCLSG